MCCVLFINLWCVHYLVTPDDNKLTRNKQPLVIPTRGGEETTIYFDLITRYKQIRRLVDGLVHYWYSYCTIQYHRILDGVSIQLHDSN